MELGLTEGKIVGLISMEAGEEREEGEGREGEGGGGAGQTEMRTRYANNIRGGGVFFPEGAAHRVLVNGRHTLLRPRKPGIKIRLR